MLAILSLAAHCIGLRTVTARGTRVAVVGAGVGGLVSAARLAQQGYEVTLIEKNLQLGGRMQSENQGDYR